jgi:hypothetical protein
MSHLFYISEEVRVAFIISPSETQLQIRGLKEEEIAGEE